jgi:hypothetical protein
VRRLGAASARMEREIAALRKGVAE